VQALIDPHAVAHNLRHLRQVLAASRADDPAPGVRLWAVVKADAYGHGLAMVYPGLHDADGLAVFSKQEAYACRQMGWKKPLLVMGSRLEPEDLHHAALFPLHWVVDDWSALRQLGLCPTGRPLHAWLRFRGHLNHGGFDPASYRKAYLRLAELQQAGHVSGIGHFCHYASGEDPQQLQEERQFFSHCRAGLPGPVCTENSGSLLIEPEQAARTDWVRTGIALYGISPLSGEHGGALGLRPAMRLQAPLLEVRPLAAGSPLGYGADFRAPHDMQIGLLACGYADGFPRRPGPDAQVLVGGSHSRIVGRVAMETLAIDLTGLPRSSPITLWGDPLLPIEHVARRADTIPAQLCTALTARVVRRQVPASDAAAQSARTLKWPEDR